MASSRRPRRPLSAAASRAHAASNSTSTRPVSVLPERSTATAIGVTARKRPASAPAHGPQCRRTRCDTIASAATPSSTWGSSTARGRKPKSFALATWIHSASGGLSTETKPAGSNEL